MKPGDPLDDRSVMLTAASAVVMVSNRFRGFMLLCNSDLVQDIWASFGASATPNALGSFKLPPGTTVILDRAVPSNAVSAVAPGGTAILTAYEG